MSYCTQADLVETYGEQELKQLSDRVNKPAQVVDAAVIGRAIADADAEIDLHLDGRYTLPLASVPLVLKRVACTLTYANLHTRLADDHPAHLAAERSRKLLSGIASGKLSLGLDSSGQPAPIANTVQVSAGRNDWGGSW